MTHLVQSAWKDNPEQTLEDISKFFETVSETCPVMLAEFLGQQIATIPAFHTYVCRQYCQCLFASLSLSRRIDFLFDVERNFKNELFSEHIQVTLSNESMNLCDRTFRYGGCHLILLLPQDDLYQIQDLCGRQMMVSPGWVFLTNSVGEIEMQEPLSSVLSMRRTRLAAMMIKWSSNVLGFSGISRQ